MPEWISMIMIKEIGLSEGCVVFVQGRPNVPYKNKMGIEPTLFFVLFGGKQDIPYACLRHK